MTTAWTCSCGRRVPGHISKCRCGQERDEPITLPPDPPSPPAAQMASAAQVSYGEGEGTSYAWVGKVATVVLLVGVYFGSRGCNRYLASRDARSAAVEALSPILGEAEAKAAVEQHHSGCFEQHYRTGWGRRQSSRFDGEKYAECVIGKLEGEVGAARRAERETSRRTRRTAAATRAPSPPPTTAHASSDDGSSLAIGDTKVLSFVRAPYLTFHVRFTATGSPGALRHATMCSYVVDCGGKAQGASAHDGRSVVACMVNGEGNLHVAQGGPATSDGACTMDLALTDGYKIRSNKLLFRLE